jgi:hypothetical protein
VWSKHRGIATSGRRDGGGEMVKKGEYGGNAVFTYM